MTPEYTQGVCEDGAAILKDGQQMTIQQIIDELRNPLLISTPAEETAARELLAWWADGLKNTPFDQLGDLIKEGYARILNLNSTIN